MYLHTVLFLSRRRRRFPLNYIALFSSSSFLPYIYAFVLSQKFNLKKRERNINITSICLNKVHVVLCVGC